MNDAAVAVGGKGLDLSGEMSVHAAKKGEKDSTEAHFPKCRNWLIACCLAERTVMIHVFFLVYFSRA